MSLSPELVAGQGGMEGGDEFVTFAKMQSYIKHSQQIYMHKIKDNIGNIDKMSEGLMTRYTDFGDRIKDLEENYGNLET